VTHPTWRRPSRCESGHCVEVKIEDTRVLVRDSKLPDEPGHTYTHEQWRQIVEAVRADEWLDGLSYFWAQWVNAYDGTIAWIGPHTTLHYTRGEIDTFVAAVKLGEFDMTAVAP
jgi:uncharacterized protein DUF397